MESTIHSSSMKTSFGLFVAATAWFSVIFQLIIATVPFGNFISFFTIECNLLVATALTWSILLPHTSIGKFFSGTSVQTAIALYIFIVALVYNTVLRGLFDLKGWGYFLDNMLHVVVPLLFVLYWAFFTPKKRLEWKDGLYWVIFPTFYLIYSMIRGAIIHWYPYPFLDADTYGYETVSVNVLVMIAAFLSAGIVLIWINRMTSSK